MRWRNLVNQFIPLLFTAVLLSSSVVSIDDPVDRARQYTAPVEYDYVRWLATAMSEKSAQAQLNAAQRLSPADQSDVVRRYFELIRELEEMEAQIQRIYTDPSIEDPESSAAAVLRDHSVVETALADLAPLVTTIRELRAAVAATLPFFSPLQSDTGYSDAPGGQVPACSELRAVWRHGPPVIKAVKTGCF